MAKPHAAVGLSEWPLLSLLVGPLRALWWLFSNPRWAMGLLTFVAGVGLLGTVLPQVPSFMRGVPAAEDAWVELRRDEYGPLTDFMHRVGLFDIFQARWFAMSMGLMIASNAVYIVGRIPAVWLGITRPRRQVPDRYFEVGPNRYDFPTPAQPLAFAQALRNAHYKVDLLAERGATYLFADKFAWANVGTLLTHGAIVIFVLAAVISRANGFSVPIFLAEGLTAPVFPVVVQPDQMQVRVLDAVGVFGSNGLPTDYRTEMAIYQGGQEVKRCVSTVNSPCEYRGYRFHQAAYYGYGAELLVRDLSSGNAVYHETLALEDQRPAPHITVREAGTSRVLFDDAPVLGAAIGSGNNAEVAALARIGLEGGQSLVVGLRRAIEADGGDWMLLLLGAEATELREGQSITMGGLEVRFTGVTTVPALLDKSLPGAGGDVLLQMCNVFYGTGTTSEGNSVSAPVRAGTPTLTALGVGDEALVLKEGESQQVGGYGYTFLGRREFTGLQVKKDNSDNLIWIATGLLLAGLFLSFWVPRRRVWAKITGVRTQLVGQSGQMANLRREFRSLAEKAGAQPGDEED